MGKTMAAMADSGKIAAMARIGEKTLSLKGEERSGAFERLVHSKIGPLALVGSLPEKLLATASFSCGKQWANDLSALYTVSGPLIYKLIRRAERNIKPKKQIRPEPDLRNVVKLSWVARASGLRELARSGLRFRHAFG